MKVDFLILGSQKGGSTWLYDLLHIHPNISSPKEELHFFSDDKRFANGSDWYHSQFITGKPGGIYGEKTPEYLTVIPTSNNRTSVHSVERIFSYNPGMKLLITLREPVSRIKSAITHMYRTKRIPPWVSAHDLFLGSKRKEANQFSLLENGLYFENIVKYLEYFPKSQVKIIFFETDIVQSPKNTIEEVCAFLNVPADPALLLNLGKKRNEYQMSLPALTLNWLFPGLRILSNRLNHIFKPYKVHLDSETEKFLRDYYRESNKKLKSLVGELPGNWNY